MGLIKKLGRLHEKAFKSVVKSTGNVLESAVKGDVKGMFDAAKDGVKDTWRITKEAYATVAGVPWLNALIHAAAIFFPVIAPFVYGADAVMGAAAIADGDVEGGLMKIAGAYAGMGGASGLADAYAGMTTNSVAQATLASTGSAAAGTAAATTANTASIVQRAFGGGAVSGVAEGVKAVATNSLTFGTTADAAFNGYTLYNQINNKDYIGIAGGLVANGVGGVAGQAAGSTTTYALNAARGYKEGGLEGAAVGMFGTYAGGNFSGKVVDAAYSVYSAERDARANEAGEAFVADGGAAIGIEPDGGYVEQASLVAVEDPLASMSAQERQAFEALPPDVRAVLVQFIGAAQSGQFTQGQLQQAIAEQAAGEPGGVASLNVAMQGAARDGQLA